MSKNLKDLAPGKYRYLGDGIIVYRAKDGSLVYGFRWRERGTYKQKMVGTNKTEAIELLHRKRAQVIDKKLGLAVRDEREEITLAAFAPEYLKRHEKKRSANRDQRGVRRVLLKHLGNKPISEICEVDVARIQKARRAEGCADATINRDIALLHHMLNEARTLGYLEHNPIAGLRWKLREAARTPYIFTPDEIDKLVEVAPPSIRHMIALAVNTGMRSSELLALNWEDIDGSLGVITVRHSKSGKARYLHIGGMRPVLETLRALRPAGIKPEGPVFRTSRGTRYKHYAQDFKAALSRAGIPSWVWFHDLRHTFGTVAAGGAASLPSVQQAMGHSSIQVTMRYVHMMAKATSAPLSEVAKWRESGRNVLEDDSDEAKAGGE